ncbi:hypothetical protein GUITHDRAFT_80735 [Guillardia theta CCMP2712]|uniref:Sodium/potassium exporting P-type ATPase 1 n=2 Tax=Guillardia theta TaxID=55529 RepID=L1IDR5_GUITC|nr:hypothetical protein GUITHDRAFT_80735 [Guillardia theta CCMP2712]EKX34242.1 hypothetical protein GUITHDRAFT_80735 [Guillardia theta CCMP2712]|eukprot:XP_005821222.1 hypothetical protein GUITHDRAFT_80735 [Guillardia theta CCMP2712]
MEGVKVEEEEYWHSETVDKVLELQESKKDGLTHQEAQKRLEVYGKNEMTPPPKIGFLMKLFLQINNILIYILIAAAIVSGVLKEYAEVALIVGVVVLNVTIGMIQEGKAEKAAEAIKGMLSAKATVIRDGQPTEVPASDVVPGDVVSIKAGDAVPADLRMFETSNLKILEAMLTGESNPISKHTHEISGGKTVALGDRKNMAFSATTVQAGQGKGIVVGTGDAAEIGKISSMVSEQESVKTNLMIQLEIFGRWVSLFVFVIAAVTFTLAKVMAEESVGTAFQSAVSIAVAIIPEGLPAVVTISLALAMQLLANQNAIVKQLPAVETLGSVTVICSDKTGTLTKNEMTVQRVQTTEAQYPVKGVGYSPELGTIVDPNSGEELAAEHKGRVKQMFEGVVLCNDSGLNVDSINGRMTYIPVGYPTEVALLTLGMKLGIPDLHIFKKAHPRVAAVPFASEHKFMCCVHATSTDPNAPLVLHVKGAPDRILPRCKNQVCEDDVNRTQPLVTKFWEDRAADMSSEGLRCLAVARADWDRSKVSDEMDADILLKAPEPFLTLIGLVAILDPPREAAIEACGVAKTAGIQVKMITGDHPQTAAAIAKQLGIFPPNLPSTEVKTFTGPQLDAMSEEEMDKIVLGCNVFARASPENKIQIVKSLQRVGQTCSMTGDGVNDAPALKAANIGVAMGITGTDVSKEAAKMVLADDNFATIVRAVREGRRVWDNLVKILLYNMPVNFAQGLSVFFAYVLRLETVPLTAIQVLYVNMITSVTMGLMLAMEPAEDSIMERPPRRKGKRLFGRMVAWHCLFVSACIVTCVLANFDIEMRRHEETGVGRRAGEVLMTTRVKKARAAAFNMLVFGEIAYAINCRYLRSTSIRMEIITGNKWCWISILITAVLQVFLTYTPGVNSFFSNEAIDGIAWLRILGMMIAIFLFVELEKAIGPKYLMPLIRQMGLCQPSAGGTDMSEDEREHFRFLATSASTIGMPIRRSRSLSRSESRDNFPHGTSQPVSHGPPPRRSTSRGSSFDHFPFGISHDHAKREAAYDRV